MLAIEGYDHLEEVDAFREGLIQVQDPSSAFVGEAASPRLGARVIDVCAAPGGKSLHLADLLKGTGFVEARDLTEAKTALIEENMARCGAANMGVKVWDARVLDERAVGTADLVLADLPCSGLGILGKKPDIKLRMSLGQAGQLAKLQREILSVVWQYVKPGGMLIYSTCTVNPAENGENADWFLANFPFEPVSLEETVARFPGLARPEDLPSLRAGRMQFLPGVHPFDGFFISVFRRKE